MKQLVFILSTIFFGLLDLHGQTAMTKEEIISSWESHRTKEKFGDATFDNVVNGRIKFLADSLRKVGIDSIMIYGISYPGSISIGKEKCIPYTRAYIIWPSDENINIIFLKGTCEFINSKIDSSKLYSFYNSHKTIIANEVIMPVIFSAERRKNNIIAYSMSFISHEPNYYLHLKICETLKLLYFSENDIQNKESLFYEYNQRLKSIQLWNLMKKEIEKFFPLDSR